MGEGERGRREGEVWGKGEGGDVMVRECEAAVKTIAMTPSLRLGRSFAEPLLEVGRRYLLSLGGSPRS